MKISHIRNLFLVFFMLTFIHLLHQLVKLKIANLDLKQKYEIQRVSAANWKKKSLLGLLDYNGSNHNISKDINIIYFPSKGCAKCLNDLLLAFEDDTYKKEKLMICFDDSVTSKLIHRYKLMYRTSHKYIVNSELKGFEHDDLALIRCHNNKISDIEFLQEKTVEGFSEILSRWFSEAD